MNRKISLRERVNSFLNPLKQLEDYVNIVGPDGKIIAIDRRLPPCGTSNPRTALSFTAVYGCVDVISGAISSLPCSIYKRESEENIKAYEHPLYTIVHSSVNEYTTAMTFFETTITHLLLQGNSYSLIVRDYLGNIKALQILNPNDIKIIQDKETGEISYRYSKNGIITNLHRKQVLHIAGKSIDGIVGLSPISLFRRTLTSGIRQEEYGVRFFSNGARKIPIFSHPGKIAKEGREALKQNLRDAWEDGKVIMLEEAIKLETVTMNMSDAQFLESRIFSVQEVCRIFRVPPHKVFELSKATFSNIEHQSIDFVRDTLLPWCVRIEQAINMQLFNVSERGKYYIKFNLDGALRGDALTRNQTHAIQLSNGIITPSDWAEKEELPKPKGKHAKKYFASAQITPMEIAYMKDTNNKKNNSKANNTEDKNNGSKE